jgi:hypothetical protein
VCASPPGSPTPQPGQCAELHDPTKSTPYYEYRSYYNGAVRGVGFYCQDHYVEFIDNISADIHIEDGYQAYPSSEYSACLANPKASESFSGSAPQSTGCSEDEASKIIASWSSDGLSVGAIVGIVVGVLLIVPIAGVAVFWFMKRKTTQTNFEKVDPKNLLQFDSTGLDSGLYG